ncbi:hypothetical protein D9757_001331 [Collybiopsis confluens]|uniref:BTB domain-containing protein n=1 Tax=Collybiopsis confluens TaxID=2823264 RepID=A0A8H5MGF8_9AGAR|nr:hypothetical protein D9757_001331 [Collybiopsis confluens]
MSSPGHPSWTHSSPSLLRHSYSVSSSSSTHSVTPVISSPSPRPPTSSWANILNSPSTRKLSSGTSSAAGYNDMGVGISMRSWTFMGFEWQVGDVCKLRDAIEGSGGSPLADGLGGELNDFDILKHSPIIGDGKFKLEVARTTSSKSSAPSVPHLSLYVTPLNLEFAHPQYEMNATMMAGIKCEDDKAGERGSRADWSFEIWHDWVFRVDNEVWECALPSLSTLLEHPRIAATDSFIICIQIHSPVGPSLPAQPSVYYVPKNLLDGLENSLDNPNTGDVQFICLERFSPEVPASPTPPTHTPEILSPVTVTGRGHNRPSSSTSSSALSSSPFAPEMTARKRIIYAHSDILTSRSEYFATMLSSAFSENQTDVNGRKIFTIIVEEAYETVYWLLKYVYANWLLFKEVDDPRQAVEGVGRGWSTNWLHGTTARGGGGGGEWDWKIISKHGLSTPTSVPEDFPDLRSTGSDESRGSVSPSGKVRALNTQQPIRTTATPSQGESRMNTSGGAGPSTTQKAGLSSSTMQRTTNNAPTTTIPSPSAGANRRVNSGPLSVSSNIPRGKHVPTPLNPGPSHAHPHYPGVPLSPNTHSLPHRSRESTMGRTLNSSSIEPDPHPHPTPPPPPASALSIYQVAHRYSMPGLSALALDHMISTLTPQRCFALLLAVESWDEVRMLVEDYVVDKWDEVSVSEEFELCCQEVAAGEWGSAGGKTLMALFRRLRSPNALI